MARLPGYVKVVSSAVEGDRYVLTVRLRLWHPRLWWEVAKAALSALRGR